MSTVQEQVGGPVLRPFNAYEKDCFGRFINRTDPEITTLILEIQILLGRQGERDQDDQAVLNWDQAKDLATVAEKLWRFRLNQGWHDDADRPEERTIPVEVIPVSNPSRWDRETERRHAALELAIKESTGTSRSSTEIAEVAEEFYRFLTKSRRKPEKEE